MNTDFEVMSVTAGSEWPGKGRPIWVTLIIALLATQISEAKTAREYFPPPESEGGWRTLSDPDSIRRDAGMDPAKLREWLRQSDHRQFAAVVIRRGHLVMQEERGKSAVTGSGRIASCSKGHLRHGPRHRVGGKPERSHTAQDDLR